VYKVGLVQHALLKREFRGLLPDEVARRSPAPCRAVQHQIYVTESFIFHSTLTLSAMLDSITLEASTMEVACEGLHVRLSQLTKE
jgi:hypothetical protein